MLDPGWMPDVMQKLDELEQILTTLSPLQLQWCLARTQARSDAQAARAVNVRPETVTRWKNRDGLELDRAVELLLIDCITAARLTLQEAAAQAAITLVKSLKGRNAVRAATEILDRVGLQVTSKLDVTTGGESLNVHVYIPDNGRDD